MSMIDDLERLGADELRDQERRWSARAEAQAERVAQLDAEIEALTRLRSREWDELLDCRSSAVRVRLALTGALGAAP